MKIKQLITGWINYYRIGHFKNACKKIDEHLHFRLRIWKQWKIISKRYKSLKQLGIPKEKAWEWANCRKGYARVASSYIMQRAVPNQILEKRGLVSLLDQFQLKHISY